MITVVIILAVVATAYVWYVTIQGFRTGVVRLKRRIDRNTSPRLFRVALVAVTALSVVCLGASGLLIYGETHPEWRQARNASH